jgi:hypothetical protein
LVEGVLRVRVMSLDVGHQRDPHVVALRYKIEHSAGLTFGHNPPPLERETEAFHLRLADEVATFTMKEHHASVDSARQVVEEYLRPWEIVEAVRPRSTGLRFVFDEPELVDRDTSPRGPTATVSLVPKPHAVVELLVERYPDPPEDFAASQDVEVMWRLYEGYLQGRDRLLPMAYTCLTRLAYTVGGAKQEAAKRYRISSKVLKKRAALSASGDEVTARKWVPGQPPQPLTAQEIDWVERAIRLLILRAGQYAADPTRERPEITLAHLPEL